jgi:hypothetical protein
LILAGLAIAGYWGVIPPSLFPAITPALTFIFLGAAAFTTVATFFLAPTLFVAVTFFDTEHLSG